MGARAAHWVVEGLELKLEAEAEVEPLAQLTAGEEGEVLPESPRS